MFHVWNKIKLIPAKNMYNIYKSLYRKMFYVSFYKNSRHTVVTDDILYFQKLKAVIN